MEPLLVLARTDSSLSETATVSTLRMKRLSQRLVIGEKVVQFVSVCLHFAETTGLMTQLDFLFG